MKKIILSIIVCLALVIAFFAGNQDIEKTDEVFINPVEVKVNEVIIPKELPKETSTKQETENQASQKETEETIEIEKEVEKEENTCTLLVRCDSVLKNLEMLKAGKEEIIPTDGIIYPRQIACFSDGESVFDILYRELKENNIHFEFVKTPMYDSMYIEGIANLYEFDCGNYSGWTYKVNGIKPTYGCSQYKAKKGDVIEFIYSCNFLKDTE